MKIRTQLLVAFLLLSVLPLAGIVLYTFLTSQAALRSAFEAEAAEAASGMQDRLESVSQEVESRLARIGEGSGFALLAPAEAAAAGRDLSAQFLRELGETAPFLESLQIVPEPPSAAEPGAPPPAPPAPGSSGAPEVPPAAPAAAPSPNPPAVEEPEADRIDIPEIDVDKTADLEEAMQELGSLGSLGKIVGISVRTAFEMAEREIAAELEAEGARSSEETAGLAAAREGLRLAQESLRAAGADWENASRAPTAPADDRLPSFEVPVTEEGRVVGRLRGQLRARALLERVLSRAGREAGEVPFALDPDGELLVAAETDRPLLASLPLAGETGVATLRDEWVIARQRDEVTGTTVGIVRPIGEPLRHVRKTAVWNFALGQALVGLALVAVLLLSSRMTRQVRAIAEGAERVAQGDLQTRVPVRSRNELGQLAASFNRMAEDLSRQQQRLVEEEMRRRENELQQEMLRREYDRKSADLEEARRFQLSLLPKRLPQSPGLDLAVHMKTAAEVGGDYYDFCEEPGGLLVAIGDATGHGARAGTMVTIVKSLFSARPLEGLPEFLEHANRSIRSMELERMAMAMALVRFRGHQLTLASAGMPPLLVHRAATGRVDELVIPGTPLGSLDAEYHERSLTLDSGDTVLLMSDGFVELTDADGETLGYERTAEFFAEACAAAVDPRAVLQSLLDAGERWIDGEPIRDDVTFLVLRIA